MGEAPLGGRGTMNHELICAWLGIPPDQWPPDHYRLLGLPPGEPDPNLIEQRVHERLDAVRRYQMMHPEQATEAMNRLAQAFVCLTEPASKRLYDDALLGARPAGAPPPEPEPLLESRDPLAWLYAPPPPPPAARAGRPHPPGRPGLARGPPGAGDQARPVPPRPPHP